MINLNIWPWTTAVDNKTSLIYRMAQNFDGGKF